MKAMKYHPDKNRDDPAAEEKFKAMAKAYQGTGPFPPLKVDSEPLLFHCFFMSAFIILLVDPIHSFFLWLSIVP